MSGYPAAPTSGINNVEEWIYRIALTLNRAQQGKTNNTGTVTLTANTTTTTVTLAEGLISPDTKIHLTPTTANAAAEKPYISAVSASTNSFTITHANNAQTDRNYGYTFIG